MKILILEDEIRASQQLRIMLIQNFPQIIVLEVLETVVESVEWLSVNDAPDLIFMDIQLADGLSFEIFESIKVSSPIIFTTAYDQYSIKAFKVNSVDYLLKPIQEEELTFAIEKYLQIHKHADTVTTDLSAIEKLIVNITTENSRQRFVVKEGTSMTFVQAHDVNYFYSEESLSFLITKKSKRHLLDMTLDTIEKEVNNAIFFRINRSQIVSIEAIKKISPYFNNRLTLQISEAGEREFIVSRNKSTMFKNWVNK